MLYSESGLGGLERDTESDWTLVIWIEMTHMTQRDTNSSLSDLITVLCRDHLGYSVISSGVCYPDWRKTVACLSTEEEAENERKDELSFVFRKLGCVCVCEAFWQMQHCTDVQKVIHVFWF